MNKEKWLVITKPGCPGCSSAKLILQQEHIQYTERVIQSPNDKQKILEETNIPYFISYPQIVLFENDIPKLIGNTEHLRTFLSTRTNLSESTDSINISEISNINLDVLEG